MCSKWVLNPERRFLDPWRFLTYAFIHKDFWHLMSNVIGQMVLGFSLEASDTGNHATLRVALIYLAGIIFGAVGRINPITLAIPRTPLVGASGTILLSINSLIPVLELFDMKISITCLCIFLFDEYIRRTLRIIRGSYCTCNLKLGGRQASVSRNLHLKCQWKKCLETTSQEICN